MSRIRPLLDAPDESSQLSDFIGLTPRISHKQKHQDHEAYRQRLEMLWHGAHGVPGNCGESQSESAEEKQGGPPDSAFPAAKLVAFRGCRRRFGRGIRAGRGVFGHQRVVLEGASR